MDMMNRSDTVDGGAASESQATTSKAKPAKRKKMKPVNVQREQSSIAFPYRDLEVGVSVAQAILGAGGVPLTAEQLAGVMNLAAGGGNFVMKVATARQFALIANSGGKYELTNLGFAIVDKDDKRQRQAYAEAFLSVPLYRRVYDEFRGRQLPPRPHGLEQAFVKFGVSSKQKSVARLAFEKSASQAGFFAAGQDRLIEPIIGASARTHVDAIDFRGDVPPPIPPSGIDATGRHPFVQGLLDTLPEPNTNWTVEGRAKWLQAAANIFDLMYKGSGEIHITAKNLDRPKADE
ncbi:MAG: hypothetical protein ABSC37_09515 [Xanthobacteraceae bacterium]|jgi:hypothetical protein